MGLGTAPAGHSVACIVGMSCLLAWDTGGSIDAADWLAYAVLAALVLAVVLFSGSAVRPGRLALVGHGIAGRVSRSGPRSRRPGHPFPSLARDDGLLALFYAVCLITPLVTLRSAADRLAATVVVVLGTRRVRRVDSRLAARGRTIRSSSTTPDGSTFP